MHRDAGLAVAIAVELGLASHPIQAVEGSGAMNHVFVTGHGLERWVIRFARDPLSPNVFDAEAWSSSQAASQGVPTPAVTAFGELYGIPYGVQRFVDGRPVAGDRSAAAWSTLGAYGHVINGIQPDEAAPGSLFSRFGRDLEAAWASHLAYHLEQLDVADPLLRQGVVTREQQQRLRETVRELAGVPLRFGLSHGDLTPRNLLRPASGPLVLVDWGSASFGPAPWTDLLNIDRDARVSNVDAGPHLAAFLDGMGLELAEVWPTFERFRRLQLLDLARWATDQRPDRRADAIDTLLRVVWPHPAGPGVSG